MQYELNNAVVMVVDDTPENLMLLVNILKEQDYKVRAFPKGQMALNAALKNPPDLILLDVMMPGMDGYEVCKILKSDSRFQSIPILFISALSSTFDKLKAFQAGGVDYISKPFHVEEVQARVKAHLTIKYLQSKVEKHNHELQSLVNEQVIEISNGHFATIAAMTKLAEVRDDDTGKHIERTQTFCKLLAQELQKLSDYSQVIDDKFIDNIFNASPLHDVGKISIPDNILLKPGKLTAEEFEIMKTHTTIGEKCLKEAYDKSKNNSFLLMGTEIASCHHEKWDGTGYPRGILGNSIPISARIMAVADVYDALRSKRVYKEAFSHEDSLKIIVEGKGRHFDPAVVDVFLHMEQHFKSVRDEMDDAI